MSKTQTKIPRPHSLDWTLRDVELARKHGVSRERIRQLRRNLERPDPVNKFKKDQFLAVEWFFEKHKLRAETMTVDQIAAEIGVSRRPVYDFVRERGAVCVMGQYESLDELIDRQPGGCWVWTGFFNEVLQQPYCRGINGANGHAYARRAVFELHRRALTADERIWVTCGNRKCVNPEHARIT